MTQTEILTAVERDVPPIVETCIQEIRHIATLPAVAHKLTCLMNDGNATANDINKTIATDPAICVRILKVVNSSFYGLTKQIATTDRAVQLLGFNAVKNIALAASLHKILRTANTVPSFNIGDLWIHSVAVATGARALAGKAGLALPDEAFLAGLIHDIGIMIEVQARPQKFAEITEILFCAPGLTFRQAEERVLGATHESFGAVLCRKWNFPMQFVHVAGFHHEPMQLPESDCVLPAIVHVADILASHTGLGYSRTVETDTIDQQILNVLGLREDDIEAIAEMLPDAIRETEQLFCI